MSDSRAYTGGQYAGSGSYSTGGGTYTSYWSGSSTRTKDEWAGTPADRAFSEDVPWTYKRQAQMKFYGMLEQGRQGLARHDLAKPNSDGAWQVEPQLSAFYTSFPWPARAAVGHTLFLEVRGLVASTVRALPIVAGGEQAAKQHGLDPDAYVNVCRLVGQAVGNRAVVDSLARRPGFECVEFYRLFQAAQENLDFPSLGSVIDTVVLFGDLLPGPDRLVLHPMTHQILAALTDVSTPYWELLQGPENATTDNYMRWGERLVEALRPFLPKARAEGDSKPESASAPAHSRENYRYPPGDHDNPSQPDTVPPLCEPQPPRLDKPRSRRNPFEDPLASLLDPLDEPFDPSEPAPEEGKEPGAREAFDELARVASAATGQGTRWEDMREDLVERLLARMPFEAGPIQGPHTTGHPVTKELGGEEVGGEIFDSVVEPCEDVVKTAKLRARSKHVAATLRRNLYPSTKETIHLEYPRTSGQLDPRRLPLAEFSDAVYRRTLVETSLDPQGRALLVVAADASASLTNDQMQMCKLLLAGWMESVSGSQVDLLAGFYTSGSVRQHVQGQLIQWVYHPMKTPVISPREAVRAVASLPDSGSGGQADALSLAHLFDEAQKLRRGAQVYLVLITDCAFNKSFHGTAHTPCEEVVAVLKDGRKQFDEKLHVTLVALQQSVPEEAKEEADAVIVVDKDDLSDPAKVARDIGAYVATCIRERRNAMEAG